MPPTSSQMFGPLYNLRPLKKIFRQSRMRPAQKAAKGTVLKRFQLNH